MVIIVKTQTALRGIPNGDRIIQVTYLKPLLRQSFGVPSTIGFIRCPVTPKGATLELCKILRDRARFCRRFRLTSFKLTMLSLSQARRLGGLHRASPVPFRGSYFTSGLHPPDATPQRLIAYLYRQWSFPLILSTRLVAHRDLPPLRKQLP